MLNLVVRLIEQAALVDELGLWLAGRESRAAL